MSYAISGDKASDKRMSYKKISGGDDENGSNPLTTGQGKKQIQKIET